MDWSTWLAERLSLLLAPFSDPLDQRSLASYLGACVFVLCVAAAVRAGRRKAPRLRGVARLLFKRSVWLHRSARLDYKLYALNLVLMSVVLGFFILGSAFWSAIFADALARLLGPPATATTTHWGVMLLIGLALLLAADFGYWLGHAAMHKSDILWEFHKVHHSAEVMTPATEFRQHPVELVLIPSVIGLVSGLTFAVLTHWLGTGAPDLGALGYNLVICAHMLTFHHLRHSHINLPFTGRLGIVFHSPAHHQLHHSADPAHHDRNMGYLLSIWDWLAGTLVMPKPNQRITLGIGHEGSAHDSVGSTLWLPFRNAGALIARKAGLRRAAAAQPGGADRAT